MKIQILVDASVWLDHFTSPVDHLQRLLEEQAVVCHPLIIGELACETILDRGRVINLLSSLDQVQSSTQEEAMALLERHMLHGRGLHWVDVHLLASALISDVHFYSHDKNIKAVAAELGLAEIEKP